MPAGNGSAETEKSWNCPGKIFPPDQMTSETAWLNDPSSVTSGFASLIVRTEMVQPGTGWTSSWAIGCTVGICTSSLTASAFVSSFGTWNVSTAVEPAGTEAGLIVM